MLNTVVFDPWCLQWYRIGSSPSEYQDKHLQAPPKGMESNLEVLREPAQPEKLHGCGEVQLHVACSATGSSQVRKPLRWIIKQPHELVVGAYELNKLLVPKAVLGNERVLIDTYFII